MWLHDFGLRQRAGAGAADLAAVGEAFKGCFARVWSGEAEDDGFNRLALSPGLDWREIAMLRAYARYLRQVRFGLSQPYMEDTLSRHPGLVRELVRLFHARFDPARAGGPGAGPELAGASAAPDEATSRGSAPPSDDAPAYAIAERILGSLEAVASLDEDRILRAYFELIDGTLRTNYHQRAPDGGHRPCLALKIDPSCVHEMPEPRPRFEIFVYSPRLEGVHLRGGPIARGGIRWSDRREDFRTEVLGLLKTQMVKNAVIVPVGSKGGFVLKRPPEGRAALGAEGLACYREFISALLELTDNYMEEGADGGYAGDGSGPGSGSGSGVGVAHPPDTVRHDGDDPYLVVAADKGTATFSDTANEIAGAAGFWLGDAFASGGSDGYDHKGIGITARGAWESVKSHFRVLGLDPADRRPSRSAGIGDMSGDVFGNGMLRSRRIRLVAAFSHLHVFIDPDPDRQASFAERERLFRLTRLDLGRLPRGPRFAGRRGVAAEREVHHPLPGGHGRARRPGGGAGHPHPERRHPGDPPRPGGSPLERGHRHLRQGRVADPRGGGRPVERLGPDQRPRASLPGGRGGRQPRLHPGGSGRVRARGRAHQHRRHRQLGRGRLLRPRGQHQDPARRRGAKRHPRRGGAERAPSLDDGRGGGAGPSQQLPAERRARDRADPGRAARRGARALHRSARAHRGARPGGGGAAGPR